MPEQITLRAEPGRTPGSREARRIRRRGGVPAIVYGKGVEQPIPVVVDHHDLTVALASEAGLNTLINLDLGERTLLTLPRAVDRHPYRNLIRHVDFVTVSLTETVRTEVPVNLVGEPIGVKQGGILNQQSTVVTIECLPTDLPGHIDVDVSGLDVHDVLRVADLPNIEGVTYVDDPEEVIASVSLPAAEVEEAVEEAEEAAEVEGAEAAEAEPEEDTGE